MHVETQCHHIFPAREAMKKILTSDYVSNGSDSVGRQKEESEEFVSWYDRDPRRHAVISALALVIEKKNRGKQKNVRAILYLANDQVYFLSVTHAAAEIEQLLELIGHCLISNTEKLLARKALEAQVSDYADCTLLLLDQSPTQTDAWQLECWRMRRTVELAREHAHLQPSEISARANDELSKIMSRLSAGIDRFMASLDQNILPSADQQAEFDVWRYNYLAHADPIIRRNRRQAMDIFPLLIVEILNQSEQTPFTLQIRTVIDSGLKIVEWIANSYRVRPASAKALRYLSEDDIGESWRGKLHLLLFLLSALPPERYPKSSVQWQQFNEAVQFIRLTTRHPVCSTTTGILLGDVARRNWLLDKNRNVNLSERAKCIDTFIGDLSNVLAAYIRVEKLGTQGLPVAQAQAVASGALVSLGLRRVELLATKWQNLKREVDQSISSGTVERSFPLLLQEAFCYRDLTIVQLTSQAELTRESTSLGHCVETYGAQCSSGQSIIFSVRDRHGQARSTFEISLQPLSLSKFEVKVIQHKGIRNEAPCRDEKTAVDCFIQFLRGADALPLLVNFSRDKLRNQLEPDIARNYRYASLMSRFLADTGNGRIKFEELVDRIAVSSTSSD